MNSTTNPVVLAFDLLCANSLNESLSIEEMDTGGVPNAKWLSMFTDALRCGLPGDGGNERLFHFAL